MFLQKADQEIIAAVIAQFFTARGVFTDLADDLLMIQQEQLEIRPSFSVRLSPQQPGR